MDAAAFVASEAHCILVAGGRHVMPNFEALPAAAPSPAKPAPPPPPPRTITIKDASGREAKVDLSTLPAAAAAVLEAQLAGAAAAGGGGVGAKGGGGWKAARAGKK